MIIVEGFDCSGKTTLANKIGALLKWPVMHTGGPTTDEADVMRCLHRSVTRFSKQVVQDRTTHISESVYSMTEFPRKAALAINALREIPPFVMLVYCRPSPEFLVSALKDEHRHEVWDTDAHMERVVANARQMIAFYDTVMEIVALRVTGIIRYDRAVAGADEAILEEAKRRFR